MCDTLLLLGQQRLRDQHLGADTIWLRRRYENMECNFRALLDRAASVISRLYLQTHTFAHS